MENTVGLLIRGFVKIEDDDTGEEILTTCNDIHHGNASAVIANALVGDQNSLITYMAFGNGGTASSGAQITYKPARVGSIENSVASLYSTTYVKRLTNQSSVSVNPNANAVVPPNQAVTTYKDIVCTVVLGYGDGAPAGQEVMDNALSNSTPFVFDEMAVYAGPSTALFGDDTVAANDIVNFVNDSTTKMMTHVIFHPVQKSQNRNLKITYTIRIQMGEL